MSSSRCVALLALWLVVATATPVRRSPDLEARRRSAIDRSMIRLESVVNLLLFSIYTWIRDPAIHLSDCIKILEIFMISMDQIRKC